jgi:probable addiction module antidote protein
MFLVALRDVAEANQMAKVAESACVARESLYRMLSPTGNPTYGTLSSILAANGLRFRVDVVSPVKTDVPLVVMHEAVNGKS